MDYINSQVAMSDIPHIDDLRLRPISADYLKVLRIEWLLFTLLLLVIAVALMVFTIDSGDWWIIIMAVVLVSCLYYFIQERAFPFRCFAVREKDVVYQSGWIVRTTTACPINRIQNCSVKSGPLERKYGLASLIIYTAGTGGADLRIPGLMQQEAEALRSFILNHIESEAGAV